jgi:hypothetical protein
VTRGPVEPDGPWMQTASGHAFPTICPMADDVELEDLALGLAWTNRYQGHVGNYSVATHSTTISRYLEGCGHSSAVQLAGHLHDGHEAYIGDMTRPVQDALAALDPSFLDAWKGLKRRVDTAILSKFGLLDKIQLYTPLIREVDTRILIDERNQLWDRPPPFPWFGGAHILPLGVRIVREDPETSRVRWMDRFLELLGRVGGKE